MMMAESGDGPDRLLPEESLLTWKADGAVKIREGSNDENENDEKFDPVSVPTIVKESCEKGGDKIAMAVKRNGEWVKWSFKQYYQDIKSVAKAFIKLGLRPHHTVCVLGFNSPEWFLSDIAAIFAGGMVAGLYPTNSAQVCQFIMNDSKCEILVVEDSNSLKKLWPLKNDLPYLKKIIQYNGKPSPDYEDVMSWDELMEMGRNLEEYELEKRIANQAINQCCTLIYTSGTTGNPKGVMLSQDNVTWTSRVVLKQYKITESTTVSYLPLSHIAANMVDIWGPMIGIGTVYFADPTAMKGTLFDTVREVRPTVFMGVPRVWEKLMEAMKEKASTVSGLKQKISAICKEAGLEHHLNGKNSHMYKIGQKLVYSKVKHALGLDRVTTFMTGAAPMPPECMKYFLSLDIEVLELYGLSECTSFACSNIHGSRRLGSVGRSPQGMRIKIDNKNPDGEGEICIFGRHVMMGYMENEEQTKAAIDNEGWLHTEDIGRIDDDGFIFITGRIKELIITSGGENIAPVLMENAIKQELPCLSNVVLIGDKKKYVTAFLAFKVVVDQDTDVPTSELTKAALNWCKSIGSNATTTDEILEGPDAKVMRAIQEGIDRANETAISNATRVQRWTVLPTDISIPSGELGPTFKLKRSYFANKYENIINKMYTAAK